MSKHKIIVEVKWAECRDEDHWREVCYEKLKEAGVPILIRWSGYYLSVENGTLTRQDDKHNLLTRFKWTGEKE